MTAREGMDIRRERVDVEHVPRTMFLSHGFGEVELAWRSEAPDHALSSEEQAAFVAELRASADPAERALVRQLVAERPGGSRALDDDEACALLARLLERGAIAVVRRPLAPLAGRDGDDEPESLAVVARSAPREAAPEPEVEPASFDADVDATALAAALVEAGELGVPFCEECQKARARGGKTGGAAAGAGAGAEGGHAP